MRALRLLDTRTFDWLDHLNDDGLREAGSTPRIEEMPMVVRALERGH
jgi:hypothetical protein